MLRGGLRTNPTSGLNSASPTLTACDQSTPEVACPEEAIISLATPPPMIEPISACEELFGIRRVMEPIQELKAERDDERYSQQHQRAHRERFADIARVCQNAVAA